MATEIRQVDYRYIILDDEAPAAAAALSALGDLGIGLVGYSEFPHGQGKSQVDLIVQDTERFTKIALDMGLNLSRKKTAFLIRGDGDPGAAVADILRRLAGAHIRVTSLQAVSAGAGRFGAMLWVAPPDVEAAAKALDALEYVQDIVDESSEESFPASDAPAWTMVHN